MFAYRNFVDFSTFLFIFKEILIPVWLWCIWKWTILQNNLSSVLLFWVNWGIISGKTMTQNIFFNPHSLFPSFVQLSHKCFILFWLVMYLNQNPSKVHIWQWRSQLPCQTSLTYRSGSVLIHAPHYRVGGGLRGCGKGEGWGNQKPRPRGQKKKKILVEIDPN